jgi:Helix-turn-helix
MARKQRQSAAARKAATARWGRPHGRGHAASPRGHAAPPEDGGTRACPRHAAPERGGLEAAAPVPPVSEEEARSPGFSPRLVRSLRKRLGLSQMALARAVGVSAPAVTQWEAGTSTPTGEN